MKEPPQQVSESVRRLNPHLYGAQKSQALAPTTHPEPLEGIKTPKRIRQRSKPLLNVLEGEFMSYVEEHTDVCLIPQSIRFMLGNGIWYKPDFVCLSPLMCYEVKGPFAHRGGFENLKVAAHQYPQFTWRLVWKDTGRWQEQIILP